MGKFSRTKGATGERELCKVLSDAGFPAHRTAPMQAGHVGEGYPDIHAEGLPYHIEVKRCERVEVDRWFAEAEANAQDDVVIAYRKNGNRWRVVLDLSTFLALNEKSRW